MRSRNRRRWTIGRILVTVAAAAMMLVTIAQPALADHYITRYWSTNGCTFKGTHYYTSSTEAFSVTSSTNNDPDCSKVKVGYKLSDNGQTVQWDSGWYSGTIGTTDYGDVHIWSRHRGWAGDFPPSPYKYIY